MFLDRRRQWINANAAVPKHPMFVVPVAWIPSGVPPAAVLDLQHSDAAFSQDYRDLGVRKLMQLGKKTELVAAVSALAERIVTALALPALPVLAALPPMHTLATAFQPEASAVAGKASSPSPSNAAYFVFAAANRQEIGTTLRANRDPVGPTDGWDWRPYHPQSPESAGALAQRAAGDKNLRFVQVACDGELANRLKDAKRHKTPVVIFADPWTVGIQPYRKALEDYDELNLLNCSVLVAWNRDDGDGAAS